METQPQPTAPVAASRTWVPYVLPMFAFLLLTNFEASFTSTTADGNGIPFPYAYGAKVLIVGILTAISLLKFRLWQELVPLPGMKDILLAAALGLVVIVAWIGLDGLYPDLPILGKRTAFDPNTLPTSQKWIFLCARFAGLTLLVPIFEEFFWRSFLNRYLVDQDFYKVPIGAVTPFSALATSALFGFAHPEWLPAFLTGLAWIWLLKHTKSLTACVISHFVANLALGIYVLSTHQWKYW